MGTSRRSHSLRLTFHKSAIAPSASSANYSLCVQMLPKMLLPANRWRAPVQFIPLRYLFIAPVLFAISTALCLFVNSDANAAILWSQCKSRDIIPRLSSISIIGPPQCYLISSFHAALDSVRTKATISVILAFVGALLSVCTVESARRPTEGTG